MSVLFFKPSKNKARPQLLENTRYRDQNSDTKKLKIKNFKQILLFSVLAFSFLMFSSFSFPSSTSLHSPTSAFLSNSSCLPPPPSNSSLILFFASCNPIPLTLLCHSQFMLRLDWAVTKESLG